MQFVVEFDYQQNKTVIQCQSNEKMKTICEKFTSKSNIDINSTYFLYDDQTIDLDLTIDEFQKDKQSNIIKILVESLNDNQKDKKLIIKSNSIICPKCNENIRFTIKDYLINLYDCKNGHAFNYILLDEFEKNQNRDISKINCEKCKKNLGDIYENKFYICCTCRINLCPLCKSVHNLNHDIINYENKNFYCNIHCEELNMYCYDCKLNLCLSCQDMHKKHKTIFFGDINPEIYKIEIEMKELRKTIDIFNTDTNNIINQMKKVMKNLEIYYKIYEDMINNYINKKRNRNYELLQNLKEFNNNNIRKELNNINNDKSIGNKVKNIIDIYNKMINNDINIIYNTNNKKKITIFGSQFVKNNKNNCKIIFEDKEYKLQEDFELNDNYNKETLEIKLRGINNITNMSSIFAICQSLSSLPDLQKWNTKNITDMSFIFAGCKNLESLPDISIWNTSNVTNMSGIFCGCESLKILPDISKWDTSNVNCMGSMYLDFENLKETKDYDKENFIGGIFSYCSSLETLPDISKWNINNVTNLSGLFYECKLLLYLPDISKWKIDNAKYISAMFCGCKSLKILPDISKWNTNNVIDMSGLFANCSSLEYLPDISNWNTNNVTNMSFMLENCSELSSLPNISKWNINNVNNKNNMFYGCKINIPSRFIS